MDTLYGKYAEKYTASSKTCKLNSGHSILCLPKGRDDCRLTSQLSSSCVRHRTMAAKPRGWVLAIVAFAIAGRKAATFQQCNGSEFAVNMQTNSKIQRISFADLYHLLCGQSHIHVHMYILCM